MSVPNPAEPLQPQPFAQNPYPQPAMAAPNPYSQPQPAMAAPNPYAPLGGAQQPYAQQQPYVPPVYDAGPPKPKRPPLSKAAAHRARLAGGVGGGITWLGLGITQLCTILLALPLIIGGVVYGLGFALLQDGTSATAGVWEQTLAWLGSPWGIAIAVGIPAGILIALLGLWISTRILRHDDLSHGGLRRPVGVTWAGFGISIAAATLLSGLGSVTLPFFGGVPLGGMGFDGDGFGGSGFDPQSMSEAEVQQWLADGGSAVLEGILHPGTLLGVAGPWIALGQLLALIVPIAASVFTWWWMAHAMRPATTDAPTDATGADAADAPRASAD